MTELHEEIKKYFVKKFGIAAEAVMKDVAHEWEGINRRLDILSYYFEEDVLNNKDFNRDDYMLINRWDRDD